MSRRPVNPARRVSDGGSVPFSGSLHHKPRASPLLSVGLVVVGALLLIGYTYNSGGFGGEKVSIKDEGISCTLEVQRAMPFLKKAYEDSLHKVLHVGPDTCSVVSMLLKEDETEAWGIEPYGLEDADNICRSLVRKGIVRVADIKFQLPYKTKSFSLVIVSDALDYLTPKYLNRTLPELARVSAEGLVIFSGFPGRQRAKVSELSKFGRPDLLMMKQIGGLEQDDPYYLDLSPENHSIITAPTTSALQWHLRLGHPSISVLHRQFPDMKFSDSFACDAC